MRLRKGDKVEVMNRKEMPVSWRIAQILSGNPNSYHVQYDSNPGTTSEQVVETVPKKFVRPCPPLLQGVENYFAGDIVEIFHEYAWKIAAIVKVLEGKKETNVKKIPLQAPAFKNQYLVRLIGCSQELIIDKSSIRMRQTWCDDQWILVGKSSQGGEDVVASKPSTSNCHQKLNFQVPQSNTRAKRQHQKDHNEAAFSRSHMISSGSLKRISPYSPSIVEAQNGHAQKLRGIEKDDRRQRVIAGPILEKVDAVSYPREYLGDKNMHASFKIISTGYNQMERVKQSDGLGYSGARNSELNSSDSDACSVGSCSVANNSPNNLCIPSLPLSGRDTDTVCSDAESCYGSGSDRISSSLPPVEEVKVSIRRLELRAYRRTLEAMYASGPLSWEQEALLTNLRIMLHISNDVHLMELKHLISAKPAINVR